MSAATKNLQSLPRRGKDTERGSLQFNSRRLNSYHASPTLDQQEHMTYHRPMSGAARLASHKGSVPKCPRMSVKIYVSHPHGNTCLPTGFSPHPITAMSPNVRQCPSNFMPSTLRATDAYRHQLSPHPIAAMSPNVRECPSKFAPLAQLPHVMMCQEMSG